MDEVFKAIEGYEGLYEVSNMGRVRSFDRYNRLGRLHSKGRILRPKTTRYGYPIVGLCKEGKHMWLLVHRLVAQAFLPNPEGLPVINHKDENPSNNVVFLKDDGSVDESRSNLEWCTQKYNCNYGTRNERQVQTKINKGLADPELCGIQNRSMKEYKRMWYQKNREKKLEHDREYRQKNREKIQEYQREYRQKNKERLKEYKREQRLKKKQENKKGNQPSEESLW